MPSKSIFTIFLPYYGTVLIVGTFTPVFKDNKSLKVEKSQLKSRFFSIILLVDGRIRIRTNNYVSWSGSWRLKNLQHGSGSRKLKNPTIE
jgi:hypothetical protein